MRQPNPIYSFMYRQLIELLARNKPYPYLITKLESSGQLLGSRLTGKPDTPHNRQTLSHIIGIERWGQRRLQTLLGEALLEDDYDDYRPDVSTSMSSLVEMFFRTRAASVGTAHRLQGSAVPVTARVLHNEAGLISVAGWLTYFIQHANIEGKRVRG